MKIIEKAMCSGCRTCVYVCPVKAISVETDRDGFEHIVIDDKLCIQCEKCKSVCPMLNGNAVKNLRGENTDCGSAYAKDMTERWNGSSGGLFGILAKEIIKNEGVIYGAAFNGNLKLKTTKAETEEELYPLFKSKYLLCDIDDKFREIKKKLEHGKQVLYCSSPCQIAGLKLYLGKNVEKEYPNLFLIDFVCHGVGSQSLFDQSIEYTEKKKGIKIHKVIFRYKVKYASSKYYYNYQYSKKDKSLEKRGIFLYFPYFYAYCEHLVCRECCYACPFASEDRVGDITIGDYHTIHDYNPQIDRFAGISMFVLNTEKGTSLFKQVENNLYYDRYDWNVIKKGNRFNGVEKVPDKRNRFFEEIRSHSFDKGVRKYLNPFKDWKLVYYHLPKWIREIGMIILGGRS